MRRLLLSLGLAVAVGATVFGVAASLNLPTTEFAAGDAAVVSCDTDGVYLNWDGQWGEGYYEVKTLHIYGVADECVDDPAVDVFVTVTGAAPGEQIASLGQKHIDAPAWTGNPGSDWHIMEVDLSDLNIPVEWVQDVHLMFDYYI